MRHRIWRETVMIFFFFFHFHEDNDSINGVSERLLQFFINRDFFCLGENIIEAIFGGVVQA